MSVLELVDVTLTHGSGEAAVTALDGVSLTVPAGQLLAVTGPSGSGKSSLLAVAGVLIRPTSGRVVVDGTDINGLPERARASVRRQRIGYVFQTSNLLPSLTAREQLLLVIHLNGGRPKASCARADELLDACGVLHRADRRPHELSGGERQRVGIARALMGKPAVLLVDEPTSALDRERAGQIVDLLAHEVHSSGTAAVMVTHDNDVLDRADRRLDLRDGRLAPSSDAGRTLTAALIPHPAGP